jgi:hypothetical protein
LNQRICISSHNNELIVCVFCGGGGAGVGSTVTFLSGWAAGEAGLWVLSQGHSPAANPLRL